VSTEIRSYNSRYLDITLRIPAGCMALEEKLKDFISARVGRGRIEAKIQIDRKLAEADGFEIDQVRTRSYISALKRLKDEFEIKSEISLELLLSSGGIIKPAESIPDPEAVWPPVEDCLGRTLEELDCMRKREGDFIARDLSARLEHIEAYLDQLEKASIDLPALYQERLKERIATLTQGIAEIDPARIAQEAAILADRSDISEEMVRAASHLKQFRQMMNSDEAAGRKLVFLLQELHREFNTMGSKVGRADAAHIIIEVKSELEKIREQVQNVE
jgi:uncharacterized protein (TIGR00255 family)